MSFNNESSNIPAQSMMNTDDVCPVCNLPDPLDGNIVVCDKCKRFYHNSCVDGATCGDDHNTWECNGCASAIAAGLKEAFNLQNVLKSSSANKKPVDAISVISSSKTEAKRKYRLQLARLEEERTFQKLYLDKKYNILERIELSSTDDEDDDDNEDENAVNPKPECSRYLSKLNQPSKVSGLCSTRIDNDRPMKQRASFNNSSKTVGPTELLNASQMAARHVVPKDLPFFSGDPADWAIFLSSFEQSTSHCGYTHQENMMRLQRCLKGDALASVRSILLVPDLVPEVIRTLRMRFGRPDLIIMTQINKVRAEPTLRPDNINGLINFALVVRNLVATIEASGLIEHRNNPTLLYEVVEKLPPQIKLDWAKYKYNAGETSLVTFSRWLYELAEAASEVVPIPLNVGGHKGPDVKADHKSKSYSHNAHSADTHQTSSGVQQPNNECCNQPVCSKPWNERPKVSSKCYCCQKSGHILSDCDEFLRFPKHKMWRVINYNHLCALCLVPHRRCPSTKTCGVNGCNRRHHPCLHSDNNEKLKVENKPKQSDVDSKAASLNDVNRKLQTPTTSKSCNSHRQQEQSVLFRVVPVTLYGNGNAVDTYAFLDDGSSLTIMEDDLARELQLDGPKETLCLKWTGGASREERESRRLSLSISAFHGEQRHPLNGVRTVSSLGLPVQSLRADQLLEKYPHLKGIQLSSYSSAIPRILIGLDNWRLAVPTDIRESDRNEPIACKTRLGWVIAGSVADTEGASMYHHLHICDCQRNDVELNQLVRDFYALDSYGVTKPSDIMESSDDRRAREILSATTVRKGMHFETGLLWRFNDFKFPDSWNMAMNRLVCLERKMHRDEALAENVRKQIKEYLSKGYIRKLAPEEVSVRNDRTWFLPIFTVRNPNKPMKIRIVWDAAAKVGEVSLNSVLLKGPDLMTSLPDLLWRFRERRVAITGDIKEMFHQVRIRPSDRESQRFLWRDGHTTSEPDVYEMMVSTFGATCSPCSAHYVKNLNASDFKASHPRAVSAILHNHYVDDWLDSVDTEQQAIKLAADVKFVHSQGGFEIRHWRSNSIKVLRALGSTNDDVNKSFQSHLEPEKVLGMLWNASDDSFCYSVNRSRIGDDIISGAKRPTKREVLKVLMMIFDPLGLIAHFLIHLKVLMQDVWRSGIQWDQQLKDVEFGKWMNWIDMLYLIEKVQIPRCYLFSVPTEQILSFQLHIFVDASEKAYSAVAYLRVESSNSVNSVLVGAKSKVSPLQSLSIPRLELQAAVLGARMKTTILKAHTFKVNRVVFWSDSKTVIAWIRSDHRRYKQFVALRIGEILETTEIEDWRWIPSNENVADDATKDNGVSSLQSSSRWFTGPSFLVLPENEWPKEEPLVDNDEPAELRSVNVHVLVPTSFVIPCLDKCTSWEMLVRVQAITQRFIYNINANRCGKQKKSGRITLSELNLAKSYLYRYVQMTVYHEEISVIQSGSKTVEKTSPIFKMSPYIDEMGVLRQRGRIDVIEGVTMDTKRPIIMPWAHSITQLIVRSYHRNFHHRHNEIVVNEVRQKFSISRLRVLVKKIQRTCQECKNEMAKPAPPEMCALPKQRLSTFTRPFTYAGVDYFGPMEVTIGRRIEKRWGVIFTCLTIRAIHLELACSLSTDSCILAIRNFMSRRGEPMEIWSDNGTNFHGANNELRREIKDLCPRRLEDEFSRIQWRFIPPGAPHMGGSWERMVRTVKMSLSKILPTRRPSEELLRSILIEIEGIVNSRPLTYMPLESPEDEALTPNHFLLGSSSGMKPPGVFDENGLVQRKNWRISQIIADRFWRRWVQEYLPTIARRTKWFEQVKSIKIGDVVMMFDDERRNSWKRGRIIDTIEGSDGQVRTVTIQTATGVYKRPAARIAVLDVRREKEDNINSQIVDKI